MALINSCDALGSFAVAWIDARTGNPDASYLLMAASLLISGLITLAVGLKSCGQSPPKKCGRSQPA